MRLQYERFYQVSWRMTGQRLKMHHFGIIGHRVRHILKLHREKQMEERSDENKSIIS